MSDVSLPASVPIPVVVVVVVVWVVAWYAFAGTRAAHRRGDPTVEEFPR